MEKRKQYNFRGSDRIGPLVEKLAELSRYKKEDIYEVFVLTELDCDEPEIRFRKQNLDRLRKEHKLGFLKARGFASRERESLAA